MNVKKEKLIIVVFIVLVVILSLFVLYKNNIFDNDSSYKMVKILDYYENKYNGNATHIVETEKYYIFEHKVDNSIRTFLYDKSGNDVTKSVLGVDNIDYISYTDDGYNYVVRTVDNKYGLFDKDFNELININDLVIQETGNKNYFIIGNKYDLQGWNVIDNVGVYDKNGKLVIPREYETIRYASSYFDIDNVWCVQFVCSSFSPYAFVIYKEHINDVSAGGGVFDGSFAGTFNSGMLLLTTLPDVMPNNKKLKVERDRKKYHIKNKMKK